MAAALGRCSAPGSLKGFDLETGERKRDGARAVWVALARGTARATRRVARLAALNMIAEVGRESSGEWCVWGGV